MLGADGLGSGLHFFYLRVPAHWPRGNDSAGDVHWFRFVLIRLDTENDLALCKTADNPFESQDTKRLVHEVVLEDNVPPDGTAVGFEGFPLFSRQPIAGQGTLGSYINGNIGNVHGLVLVVHASCWPGSSGSPLFLDGGRVIGLMTNCGQANTGGISVARPSTFIRVLLESQGVRP